ncbi:MAG: alpha/beta fold hydrolase [Myxococcota bacterium]
MDEGSDDPETVRLRYAWMNLTDSEDPPVLVFQFGGPGSSAVEFLARLVPLLPDWLTDRYAVVGMDEIGVGGSVPIRCPSLGMAVDEDYLHPFVDSSTQGHVNTWRDSTFACQTSYRYADQIGTERHARDLERLRIELQKDELHFFTYSYGTKVALTYAAQFPARVGRMVLDSPVDPRVSHVEQLRLQTLARNRSLLRFLDWCDARAECTFSRDDFLAAFDRLSERSPSSAIEFLIILQGLLFELQWPSVASSLAAVLPDVDTAPRLVNSRATIVVPPAFVATVCADSVLGGFEQISAERAMLFEQLDTTIPAAYFSDVFNGAYACVYWPTRPSRIDWPSVFAQHQFEALMVNSTGDTRAPREYADALGVALPDAARVRVDEFSHSVSLQGINSCVDDRVMAFLTGMPGEVSETVDCPKSTAP